MELGVELELDKNLKKNLVTITEGNHDHCYINLPPPRRKKLRIAVAGPNINNMPRRVTPGPRPLRTP